MTSDAHDLLKHDRIELKRCVALLADAIARAERWYARREAELVAFDRRTKRRVDRLRIDGSVQPSLIWQPAPHGV